MVFNSPFSPTWATFNSPAIPHPHRLRPRRCAPPAMPGGACLLAVLLILAAAAPARAQPPSQAGVLLRFKAAMTDAAGALGDWTSVANAGPCLGGRRGNWTGVYCEDGKVIKLVLENMALSGALDFAPLAELQELRSLSLMNNSFDGALPSLRGLLGLRSLYLARNQFSGDIAADAFAGMNSVWALHLEHNSFAGAIPASLTALPNLAELSLQDNAFSGRLPEFKFGPRLKLNVSYNRLEGPIPASLSAADPSSFAGNEGLCGAVLGVACAPSSAKRPPSTGHAAVIWAAAAVVGVGIAAVCLVGRRRRGRRRLEERQLGRPTSSGTKKPSSSSAGGGGKDAEEETKLVVIRERNNEKIDLQSLLGAPAEAMASGGLRTFKVILPAGPAVAVKRYAEMNGMDREKFHEHMRRLGALSHPNLLPLLAYNYRKKEKLLVTDYVPNGSLHDLLHGSRSSERQVGPDWGTRLRILKGAARGLLYLCREMPMLTTPHGHLKASNVLLDGAMQPLLGEYGLSPVLNPSHAHMELAVYRSPEFAHHGRITKKSDVWTLGVLILEVLTGKDPDRHARRSHGGPDASDDSSSATHDENGAAELAAWAESMVREEREEELFDEVLPTSGTAASDMRRLLRVALACCEPDVGDRWDVAEAWSRIDELRDPEAYLNPQALVQ
ncbi:pollen receptor-like kinase 1 [Wolffia australiana]